MNMAKNAQILFVFLVRVYFETFNHFFKGTGVLPTLKLGKNKIYYKAAMWLIIEVTRQT